MSPGSRLADRGVTLSRIGFGTAQFGNLYRASTDEEAAAAVGEAWAGGIRYFDTAPHYGLGLSERRLGQALQGLPRDEVVISSKVGRLLRPNPSPRGRDEEFDVPDDLTRVWDFSAAGVRASVEETLQRMHLDHLDIAYVHDADDHWEQAISGAVPELERMREEGIVRAWGAGMNQAAMLQRFAAETSADVLMMAGRHTLLRQHADELLDSCLQTGVTVVAAGVFNSGILAAEQPGPGSYFDYQPAPAEVVTRARAIAAVCRQHGTTLPAAAIAYPLQDAAISSVVLGMHDPGQVRDNVALAARPVPSALFEDLAERELVVGSRWTMSWED